LHRPRCCRLQIDRRVQRPVARNSMHCDRAPDRRQRMERTMKIVRRCVACGNPFRPRSQNPNQHYCSALACQRERRRQWQRQHLQSDPDYRDNQARAQANWRARHPNYWRRYRATHPAYLDRNRSMQRQRNACRRAKSVANMDASAAVRSIGVRILRLAARTGDQHCKDERVRGAHRRCVSTQATRSVIANR
jgi:hypothetical protein